MAASVADVGALEEHLPDVLQQHTADIQSAPIVMLDGNLSPEALLVRIHSTPHLTSGSAHSFQMPSKHLQRSIAPGGIQAADVCDIVEFSMARRRAVCHSSHGTDVASIFARRRRLSWHQPGAFPSGTSRCPAQRRRARQQRCICWTTSLRTQRSSWSSLRPSDHRRDRHISHNSAPGLVRVGLCLMWTAQIAAAALQAPCQMVVLLLLGARGRERHSRQTGRGTAALHPPAQQPAGTARMTREACTARGAAPPQQQLLRRAAAGQLSHQRRPRQRKPEAPSSGCGHTCAACFPPG